MAELIIVRARDRRDAIRVRNMLIQAQVDFEMAIPHKGGVLKSVAGELWSEPALWTEPENSEEEGSNV